MKKRLLWIAPLALMGMAAFAALGGWAVMSLWNWLTPALFGWHVITFWQALGLLLLCRILMGGFGLHGGPRSRIRDRIRARLSDRIAERWGPLSPEERERLREMIHSHFGPGGSAADPKAQ